MANSGRVKTTTGITQTTPGAARSLTQSNTNNRKYQQLTTRLHARLLPARVYKMPPNR